MSGKEIGSPGGTRAEECTLAEEQEIRNQYHPAFCAGMELILSEWGEALEIHKEYHLNAMPNRIDFLVVKNEDRVKSGGELGAIFRKYNLFEYKSPGQELGWSVYDLMMAYVYLFKAYEGVKEEHEFTITFVREGVPLKLMKEFRKRGYEIARYADGIYHVKKDGHIDMQIITTRWLEPKYDWIRLLTDKVTEEEIKRLSKKAAALKDEKERMLARSVFDLIKRLNEKQDWFKEVGSMAGIRDLFQAEFDEKDRVIAEQGETITELNEQLHTKEEQLNSKDAENSRLKEELKKLKEMMGMTAVF
jgi:uncharacterized coiled-coil protein SlyX